MGAPGLSELLGLGFCSSCGRDGQVDFARALLDSPLLTEEGKAVVREGLILEGRDEVRDLYAVIKGDKKTVQRLLDEGRN